MGSRNLIPEQQRLKNVVTGSTYRETSGKKQPMDEAAFVALIKEHQGIIHKICRLYRDGREDREDLFQEITFQLWKSLPAFKSDAKISTWLYRIALNTAIATFRQKKPQLEYPLILPDLPEELPNEVQAWQQENLLHALKQLNDGEKAIITLYLEEQTYQQIAEIVGINENYVGVKLNRIKTKIQNLLTS